MVCRACHTRFGKVRLDNDGFPRSGRWWMFLVPAECSLDQTALKAMCRRAIQNQEWVYVGGSYWASSGQWVRAEFLRLPGVAFF